VYPITAKLMHEDKFEDLNVLYKKNLLTSCGWFCYVVHFVNIKQLYEMVPCEYGGGILVVL
jgi:hypothetical protein